MNIHEIKNNNEIGSVIERYVTLSWKGYKGTGLCPFHDDRHPSLTVYRNKQQFICYACGAKGDVINFVERTENCTFKEALEKLNTKWTMENNKHTPKKEFSEKPKRQENPKVKKPPVDLHEFLKLLMPYATGNPDLSEIYLEFEVGLAPEMVPPPFKPLAGRIIFPVRDEDGMLRGFAGRKQSNEGDAPKYMNTTAEDGFRRSEILYGLYKAKASILDRGYAFIVEGYKDVLAMHAAGYTNTVGLCGTIMTKQQQELLAEYTMSAVLMLDSDEAGKKAAIKIEEDLAKEGVECLIYTLPEVSDPDSLFRTVDKEYFHQIIKHCLHSTRIIERMFVAVCYYYKDLEVEIKEGSFLYRDFIYSFLKEEEVLPASPLSRKLLKYLANDIPFEDFPKEMKQEINYLQERTFNMFVLMEKAYLQIEGKNDKSLPLKVINFIYLQYMENRLMFLIRKVTCQLQHETDMKKRTPLLELLDKYCDHYEKISEKLEYMGVVNLNWTFNVEGRFEPFA